MHRTSLVLVVAACAQHADPPARPVVPTSEAHDEHWQTVTARRLVSPERCGVGPYEVELPARRDDWGRRIVWRVYSPRGLVIDTRVTGEAVQPAAFAGWTTGFAAPPPADGDHAHCRAEGDDHPVAAARGDAATPTAPTTAGPHALPAPPAKLPELVELAGDIGSPLVQQAALGWLPRGNPWFYADDLRTTFEANDHGNVRVRVRFWLERPSDLDGVVFEILDQTLVPELPAASYEPRFRARVADADARREASKPAPGCWRCRQDALDALVARCAHEDHRAEECRWLHERDGREPPPPRDEHPPRAPAGNLEWIAGYWDWDVDLDDFTWVAGMYVVRANAPTVAAIEPVPERAVREDQALAATASAELAPPEPEREITIADPPAPRVDAIAAPPARTGAVWIGGHWRLVGTSWQWHAGSWVVPPAGMRFQPPAVRVRGRARVYMPARWVRGR